ncbi:MAG: extradiol dioxygenase [Gemmataceae bacterium]|nr:extradiol dioxygenase [Gemmataceae bacterium]
MFYSSEAEKLREFFRDKIGFPCFDAGGGWLIFNLPKGELGCHPAEITDGQPSGTAHISFSCDNLEKTISELRSRGVEFSGPVHQEEYGLVTFFQAPGGFLIQLYQPSYQPGS